MKHIRSATASRIPEKGFALVASIIVMSLLMFVAIASMSISSVETRVAGTRNAELEAKANARLAMMEALGRLQEVAGQDQRATARAAILEEPNGSTLLPNRNWLGVWNTTHGVGNRDWPLVGKAPDLKKTKEPYLYKGIYSDLRYHHVDLKDGQWRNQLRLAWLVSSRSADVSTKLDPKNKNVLEILGRGTLGDASIVNESLYLRDRVLVEKVDIEQAGKNGAYAWYISDNSQKASLSLGTPKTTDYSKALAASVLDNPSAISLGNSSPYKEYLADAASTIDRVFSHQSTPLTADKKEQVALLRDAIGAHTHHFTTDSSGLFTDPIYGGFKKDLTPLLFGNKGQKRVVFAPPYPELADHPFSSRYPIIPGERKAAQGPSFAALRDWARLQSSSNQVSAEITTPASATRQTPTDGWVYGISDGKSFRASEWAESVPKLRPVMTDCRYHYYFSYTGTGASKKMRTHIIPRVCLWNPYNVRMTVDDLTVLMANPFGAQRYTEAELQADPKKKNLSKRFHFFFNQAEVDRVKRHFSANPAHKVHKWSNRRIYLRGNENGLFPSDRFLGFTLEKSTLEPGECLVFSPKISAPLESAQGVSIQAYDNANIHRNVLSAKEPQGEGHFVHNYGSTYLKMDSGSGGDGVILPDDVWKEMNLDEVTRYESWVYMVDNFTFLLKAGTSASTATEASRKLTNLQTMNHGNGGTNTYGFWYYKWYWGDSGPVFGNLAKFTEAPRKDAPRLHQIGTKLLWMDESVTEANASDPVPLRLEVWNSESLAYNPSIIANWNVRPHLITRSPSSPVGSVDGSDTWYTTSSGAWLQQFSPKSPQDLNDMPALTNSGYFSKPALTLATQPGVPSQMALFDLPDPDYGALSIGALRHAQLSPFSWHPTYIVGSSLADLHAPYDASSNSQFFQNSYNSGKVNTSWDYAVGGGRNGSPFSHGARVDSIFSDSFMQLGGFRSSVSLDGKNVSHPDEHLVYDISFEVNQNLWDHYFFSGMPMKSSGNGFDWTLDGSKPLNNHRFMSSNNVQIDRDKMDALLGSTLDNGFWLNAYLLKNKSAFNVNSTSIEAWTAFLSGLRSIDRNGVSAGNDSIYARFRMPADAPASDDVDIESSSGWQGARKLTDAEIFNLATYIVKEVKQRGPFVSLADFVNRRLAPKIDQNSARGALESAIVQSGLNDNFNQARYLTKHETQNDNNHPDFKPDLDKQPITKAWGIPGHLTQADILEPLAPAMTVRGDVFVIRSYGESRDASGKILATAFLEATVERTAEYVMSQQITATGSIANANANKATDPALKVDRVTGELLEGNLSDANKQYGRKFIIKSFRWMSKDEI